MKTPLTLQRLFLGLNGMAIESKELNIQVIPEYDKSGKIIGTKWNLKTINNIDLNNEQIIIKDFLAGYRIDNDDYNVQMKFYDANGRFPRQIADRISSVQHAKKHKVRKTNESAFFQLLTIIRDYYNYFDDDIISILQNTKILKAKCNIAYPLLIEIPDTIQTNDDLLKHFYLLTLFNPKTLKIYKNKFHLLIANNSEVKMNDLNNYTEQNINNGNIDSDNDINTDTDNIDNIDNIDNAIGNNNNSDNDIDNDIDIDTDSDINTDNDNDSDIDNDINTDDIMSNKTIIIEKLLQIFQNKDVFNILQKYIDNQFVENVKNNIVLKNKIRYWKKVLTLNNGKRYWISNHIFNNSIIPFKELMSDLTGISINNISINNTSINNTSINNISTNNASINSSINDTIISPPSQNDNNNNSSALDNLINNAF